MLNKFVGFFSLSTILIAFSCNKGDDGLRSDFNNPRQSMTTGCYWYWLSDNISKEGAVRDLYAMKEAGINSAFIGNIGGQAAFEGKVKIFTEEWWDVISTVLKTAGELDIEIGMFNSPGWSQSGGPWINAQESMRYLTASETRVSGPGETTVRLPVPPAASRMAEWSDRFENNDDRPSEDFQDVCVLALPVSKDYVLNLFDLPGADVSTSVNVLKPSQEVKVGYRPDVSGSSNIALRYVLPKGESHVLLKLREAQTARSLTVYPAGLLVSKVELQAKTGGEFRTVKSFNINRKLPMLHVGHVPFAPYVVSFPETVSDEFRIVFINERAGNNGAGKIILSPTPVLDDYPEKTLAKLYQGDSPEWDYYHFPEQRATCREGLVPSAGQVVDISEYMSADGALKWQAPEGEWLVLRMGMVPTYIKNSPATAEGTGLEMDKMSRAPIKKHFDAFIGEVMRRIPEKDRKTFKVMVEDSWEKAGQNFTDDFLSIFQSRYGYDAKPYLPVMAGHVIGNEDISSRFLWDVRRLAAELEASENVGGLTEIANKHGLQSWLENYGDWGFPGETLLYGKYADRVGGEFWEDQKKPYIPVAASCSHIYNKPAVYAESFTNSSDPYRHNPQTLKRFADAAFAEGMTRCVLHVYVHQAYEDMYPGIDSWFGVEFNRKNTWFGQADIFTGYLKRCGLMLERGLNVADIACFIGEDVPVNSGPFEMKNREGKAIPALPAGYRYDYVNSDIILNSMTVKDGRLMLPHGVSYRILLLPEIKTMRPEVLEKIGQLAAAGAVIAGNPPAGSPSLENYPAADEMVKNLSVGIWENPSVYRNTSLEDVFAELNITPDFQSDGENILFAHRTDGDREIYFISNQNADRVQFTAQFRVSGKAPELWNPVTGEIRSLPAFGQQGNNTAVPLQLEAYESTFVVFSKNVQTGKPANLQPADNFPAAVTLFEITSPWTVEFQSDSIHRGPSEPVIFNELTDWTKIDNLQIKYYSGAAIYRTVINTLNPVDLKSSDIFLEFDKVSAMAKVSINGKYAGGIWTPPYRINIAGLLHEGENEVEIEVVNNWINRIIGDGFLQKEERKAASPFARVNAGSPLQESGLTGKVRIVKI
jgi:hypothetical protein